MKSVPASNAFASALLATGFAFVGTHAHGAEDVPSERTTAPAQFAEVEFNSAFLRQLGSHPIDISRYNKGNFAMPGRYRADLYLGDDWLGRADIELREGQGGRTFPCIDRALLQRLNVDFDKLPKTDELHDPGVSPGTACKPLAEWVPGATAIFDHGEQRLDISVPQALLSRQARGSVDPRYWDDGVPAALLQYNANTYRSESMGRATTQSYIGLTGGLNMGAWRLRHSGNLMRNSDTGTRYQGIQTFIQRSIAPRKSQLMLGDGFTDGALFDSTGFRGVKLASDDRMYADSQRGYAPTVRGIANSHAVIQVRQNGNVIYETTVAPGPFEINDLYPTGYGGDLEVVITEADGSKRISRIPFAASTNALRPGVTRYGVIAGQFRDAQLSATPALFQATLQRGLTNSLTGYGGVTVSQGYRAALIGAALNTGFGAFDLDLTQAHSNLKNLGTRSGHSLKLGYSKLIEPSNTNITLAAYRYSSQGYLTLRDSLALQARERELFRPGEDRFGWPTGTQRAQLQLTLNQSLPQGYGNFYFSGSSRNYWDRQGRETQFQAGYSNNFGRVNFNVSVSRQYELFRQRWENRVSFSFGFPLGSASGAPYSNTTVQRDADGILDIQESLSGTVGDDNTFSYGANFGYSGHSSDGGGRNIGGNISYTAPMATLTASASQGSSYKQFSAGISGGIVGYSGGMVLTPTMGDTLAIVVADKAAGARVGNGSGLKIDAWGHAVVANLTPFSNNEIQIDPKGLPLSVELKTSSQRVAPTAGAVVKLQFEVEGGGSAVILRGLTAHGEPLPFGAQISNEAGENVGTVAQAGRVVIRGLKNKTGTLTATWGEGAGEKCLLNYSLPAETTNGRTNWLATEAVCKN